MVHSVGRASTTGSETTLVRQGVGVARPWQEDGGAQRSHQTQRVDVFLSLPDAPVQARCTAFVPQLGITSSYDGARGDVCSSRKLVDHGLEAGPESVLRGDGDDAAIHDPARVGYGPGRRRPYLLGLGAIQIDAAVSRVPFLNGLREGADNSWPREEGPAPRRGAEGCRRGRGPSRGQNHERGQNQRET